MTTSNAMASLKLRAQQLIQRGQLVEARRALEAVGVSGDADIDGLLGMVCGMLGDSRAAEVLLQRAVASRPADPRLRNNFGCVLQALGKSEKAAQQFREALRLTPGSASTAANLGSALIALGDHAAAEAVLRPALGATPAHAEVHNNLGTALRQLGRNAEALVSYETAVRLRPDYPDALANLGMSLVFENRLADAETCLRKALVGAPGHIGALYYLGFLLYKREELAEAERCFRRIIAFQPGHANAAYFLSIIGALEAPPRSPAEYVQELFDGYAEKFDEHLVGTLKYSAPEVMDRLVRQALGDSALALDILDLGCGTGLCANRFTDIASSLIGVDLSERMLDKARELGIYDRLENADVASFLSARDTQSCDLILAGDVFVYIGDLSEIFPACTRVLRDAGIISFSIEKSDAEPPYMLRTSGRYAQRPDYIADLAAATGLHVLLVEDFILREEFGNNIAGQVYVLAKRPVAS